MKAVTYQTYGDPSVLKINEIALPILNNNESLVRNYASTVSTGDIRIRAANPWPIRLLYGLFKPKYKVLGQDFAGVLTRIKGSQKFALNDAIIGTTGTIMGGHAEHVKIYSSSIIAKAPKNWTLEESATLPFGGITALYFLKQLPTIKNGKILIHGASGAIGTYAVQIAKSMGFHVTGVCSTKNLNLVRKLGADRVIDYSCQDFTLLTNEFDAVFTTVGKTSYKECRPIMKKNASYISSDTPLTDYIRNILGAKEKSHQLTIGVAENTTALLEELVQLADNEELIPVVDRMYNYKQAKEAHEYVDNGHKVGAVVLTF